MLISNAAPKWLVYLEYAKKSDCPSQQAIDNWGYIDNAIAPAQEWKKIRCIHLLEVSAKPQLYVAQDGKVSCSCCEDVCGGSIRQE